MLGHASSGAPVQETPARRPGWSLHPVVRTAVEAAVDRCAVDVADRAHLARTPRAFLGRVPSSPGRGGERAREPSRPLCEVRPVTGGRAAMPLVKRGSAPDPRQPSVIGSRRVNGAGRPLATTRMAAEPMNVHRPKTRSHVRQLLSRPLGWDSPNVPPAAQYSHTSPTAGPAGSIPAPRGVELPAEMAEFVVHVGVRWPSPCSAWSRAGPVREGLMAVGRQLPVSAARVGSPVRSCHASTRSAAASIAAWSTAGKLCTLSTLTCAVVASSTGSGMPVRVPQRSPRVGGLGARRRMHWIDAAQISIILHSVDI